MHWNRAVSHVILIYVTVLVYSWS